MPISHIAEQPHTHTHLHKAFSTVFLETFREKVTAFSDASISSTTNSSKSYRDCCGSSSSLDSAEEQARKLRLKNESEGSDSSRKGGTANLVGANSSSSSSSGSGSSTNTSSTDQTASTDEASKDATTTDKDAHADKDADADAEPSEADQEKDMPMPNIDNLIKLTQLPTTAEQNLALTAQNASINLEYAAKVPALSAAKFANEAYLRACIAANNEWNQIKWTLDPAVYASIIL